jgi:predicted nucleic acid-binding protein
MRHENVTILFLTGEDIERLDAESDHLLTALRRMARRIRALKWLDRQEVEDGEEYNLIEREEEALNEYAEELEKERDDSQGDLTDFE